MKPKKISKLEEIKFNLMPLNGQIVVIPPPSPSPKHNLILDDKSKMDKQKEVEQSKPFYVVDADEINKHLIGKFIHLDRNGIQSANKVIEYEYKVEGNRENPIHFPLQPILIPAHIIIGAVIYGEKHEEYFVNTLNEWIDKYFPEGEAAI